MNLFVLRHGKAEQSSDSVDGKRQLTAEGKDEMRKIGKWLQQKKFRFDVIATSPLTRACETAEIVARSLGQKERLIVWEELGPGGDFDALSYRASLNGEENAAILLIGHEPMLSMLISRIISGHDTVSLILAKGGLAKIRNFSFDKRPSGDLQWLLTPGQMMKMIESIP